MGTGTVPGLATGLEPGDAGAGDARGEAVGIGRAAYGEGVGPEDVPGLLLVVGVSVGPSAGGSVGVGGRGMGESPMLLP